MGIENDDYVVIKCFNDEDVEDLVNIINLLNSYNIDYEKTNILNLVGDAPYWITLNKN